MEAVGEVPVKLVENSFVVRMEMVVDFWEKEVNLADLVAVPVLDQMYRTQSCQIQYTQRP